MKTAFVPSSNKIRIPEISDAYIEKLARHIRLVVSIKNSPMGIYPQNDVRAYYMSLPKDLRAENFLKGKVRERAYLTELARITTLHEPGSAGRVFHPTVAEVFAQIPSHLIDRVRGFETFPTDKYDKSGLFHETTTVLLTNP